MTHKQPSPCRRLICISAVNFARVCHALVVVLDGFGLSIYQIVVWETTGEPLVCPSIYLSIAVNLSQKLNESSLIFCALV